MDKTARTELHRTFLVENLPEPLTRASAHIQLFDNYIANTRMRLRSIREPQSRSWTHVLQQRIFVSDTELYRLRLSEIYLDAKEYERFQIFGGIEIRKNRYFHEFDGRMFSFDIYLGKLWGLNTARIEFSDEATLRNFEPPAFLVFEVTNEPFFLGENIVHRNFADVQDEVGRLGQSFAAIKPLSDE